MDGFSSLSSLLVYPLHIHACPLLYIIRVVAGKVNYKGSKATCIISSSFITICHHRLYAVDISAEASQLHLLTLACFDRQRICVNPLVGRYVGGVMCVCKNIEDSWCIDNWEEGDC